MTPVTDVTLVTVTPVTPVTAVTRVTGVTGLRLIAKTQQPLTIGSLGLQQDSASGQRVIVALQIFGEDRRAPIAALHFQFGHQVSGGAPELPRRQQLFQCIDYQGQLQLLRRHSPAPTAIGKFQFFLHVLDVPPGGVEGGGAVLALVAH